MNTDFRIAVSLFSHPKFIKLKRRLGADGALSLLQLFSFVAQNNPDGYLGSMDAEDIAIAAGYDDDADKFVQALLDIRFLEVNEEGQYRIHDWEEHNPWAAGAPRRSEIAREAAAARWGNTKKTPETPTTTATATNSQAVSMPTVCTTHTDSMRDALPELQPSNAPLLSVSSPSPILTKPNQPATATKPCATPEAVSVTEPDAVAAAEVSLPEAFKALGPCPDDPEWEPSLRRLSDKQLVAYAKHHFPPDDYPDLWSEAEAKKRNAKTNNRDGYIRKWLIERMEILAGRIGGESTALVPASRNGPSGYPSGPPTRKQTPTEKRVEEGKAASRDFLERVQAGDPEIAESVKTTQRLRDVERKLGKGIFDK